MSRSRSRSSFRFSDKDSHPDLAPCLVVPLLESAWPRVRMVLLLLYSLESTAIFGFEGSYSSISPTSQSVSACVSAWVDCPNLWLAASG